MDQLQPDLAKNMDLRKTELQKLVTKQLSQSPFHLQTHVSGTWSITNYYNNSASKETAASPSKNSNIPNAWQRLL